MANEAQNELNKENIEAGKANIKAETREQTESIKAMQEGKISSQNVERIMTREEVLLTARENGIYINMLAPCLAANINLDNMILEFFDSPMKEIDLEDRVKDVMNVILQDVSKAQNGLVFHPDGNIDFKESLKQSAAAGIPPTSMLLGGMESGDLNKLMEKYGNETKLAMLSSVNGGNVDNKHFLLFDNINRNVFNQSIGNYTVRQSSHNDFHNLFDQDSWTEEEKDEIRQKREILQKEMEEIKKQIEEKRIALRKIDKEQNPEDYKRLEEEILALSDSFFDKKDARYALGNPEDDSRAEIDAKAKVAKVYLAGALITDKDTLKRLAADMQSLPRDILDDAMGHERVTRTVQTNFMRKFADEDVRVLKEFKDEKGIDNLSEAEKQEYLIAVLKTYFVYTKLQESLGSKILDPNISKDIVRLSMSSLELLAPSIKRNKDGSLDLTNVISDVNAIPGYENVTLDNIGQTLINERNSEIMESIDDVVKSADHDIFRYEGYDMTEYIENLSEGNNIDFYSSAINYLRVLEERGLISNMPTIIVKRLEKSGYTDIKASANERYELAKDSISNVVDNFIVDSAMKEYSKFKKYEHLEEEHGDKDVFERMNPEEKIEMISKMLAAHRVLDKHEHKNEEAENAVKNVVKKFMPNAIDKDGNIDELKLVEEYNKLQLNTKFVEDGKADVLTEFYSFHENFVVEKLQKMFVSKIIGRLNEERGISKPEDKKITENEAKKVAQERSEELDTSAIDNPKERKENIALVTDKEAKTAVEEKGEDIIVNESPELGVDKQVNDIEEKKSQELPELENINVAPQTAMVVKEEKGTISKWFNKIKDKIVSLFSKGEKESNNDNATASEITDSTSNNSTSSAGVKDVSENVKGLTGYDAIKLQFNTQEKAEAMQEDAKKIDEAVKDENEGLEI